MGMNSRVSTRSDDVSEYSLDALDHLPDPILVIDPELNILWANRAAAARAESDPEKLLGNHCFCLWPGDPEPCEGCPAVRARETGEPASREVILSSGDVWQVNAVPLMDDAGTVRRILITAQNRTSLRNLESRLINERERFKQTLENLPDGVFTHNMAGDLILVNRAACDLTGYSREKLLAMKVWEIDAEIGDRDDPGHIWQELEVGSCVRIDAVHRRKDGSSYPVGVHISKIIMDGEPVMLGVVRDLTGRRQAEEALRSREARISSLFDSVQAGIILQAASGEILRVNQRAEEIFGMSTEEITGRTSEYPGWEMIDKNGVPVPGHDHPSMITLRTGKPLRNQLMGLFIRDPQRTKWLLINTEPLFGEDDSVTEVLVTFTDITDLRLSEERLRLSMEELKLTLEATTTGLWTWWFADNRLEFSPRYYTMLGYDQGAFPATLDHWVDMIHDEDRPGALARTEKWLEHKTGEYRNTFRLKSKDGTFRCIESRGKVVERDTAGAAIRMIGTHEDVTEEMKLLSALRVSEARFRKLTESMPDHVMLLDEDLRITYLNITSPGLEMSDVLGSPLYELAGEDAERVRSCLEQARDTGEPTSYGTSYPIGERKLYYDSKAVRINLGEAKILVVSRDVTVEREQSRELELLNRSLIESQTMARLGHWQYDIASGETVWSDEMFEVLGCPKEKGSLNYKSHREFIHPEDREMFDGAVQRCIEGTPYDLVLRILFPDGSCHWINSRGLPIQDEDGKISELFGIILDITHVKESEAALRRSESMLARTERIARMGSWEWIVDTDTVIWSNELYRLFGMDPDSCVPSYSDHSRLFGPEALAMERLVVERALATGEPFNIEIPITVGEEVRICRDQGYAEQAPDGRVTRLYGTFQDITELRRSEEERDRLRTQLTQMQRMDSIGRLAGGVAHDFNNKLQTILGYTSLALDTKDLTGELRDSLMEISHAAESSADLTRQLLAFARKQTISPKVLDLNRSIENLLGMFRRLIGEDIDLVWRPFRETWPVLMDSSQLDQMLANLIVNARDSISGRGTVTIQTGNRTLDKDSCMEHPEATPGEYSYLSVTDDGCGIDREILEHIFELFFTTKPTGEGTGLGLATVFGITRQNGGFPSVYSEPGKGSVFRVYLPRCLSDESSRSCVVPDTFPMGDETILVAEDESALLDLCGIMLRSLGYRVLLASSPEEAVVKASDPDCGIDLLMADVVMPDMNGLELMTRLNEIQPGMSTLFMSGYTADVIADHGILQSGMNFIQKPFSRSVLANKLREVLDHPQCQA